MKTQTRLADRAAQRRSPARCPARALAHDATHQNQGTLLNDKIDFVTACSVSRLPQQWTQNVTGRLPGLNRKRRSHAASEPIYANDTLAN